MNKLKLAYFGTPDYSARLLEKIVSDKTLPVEVVLVVTQPNRPVGKKQVITPSPVKLFANSSSFIVHSAMNHELITKLQTIDLALVCAYGQILPKELLAIPKYGFWNIHYSLLPRYRGGSPSSYALMLGDKKTGTTILQMDEKLDHGPIIAQEETEILPDEKRPELEMRLTNLTFRLFKKLIMCLSEDIYFERLGMSAPSTRGKGTHWSEKCGIKLKHQNHSHATYARLLKKDDGFIPFSTLQKALKNEALSLEELPPLIKEYLNKYPQFIENFKLKIKNSPKIIYDYFRGMFPWPGIWTKITVKGVEKRLKIIDIDPTTIHQVQLEGKKEVDFATFNQAYRIF